MLDPIALARVLDNFQVVFRLKSKNNPGDDIVSLGQTEWLCGYPYLEWQPGGELEVIALYPIGELAARALWGDFERGLNNGHNAPLLAGMAELISPRLEDVILPPPAGDGKPCCAHADIPHAHRTFTG